MTLATAPPHLEMVRTHRGARGRIFVRDDTSDLSLVLGHMSIPWAEGQDEYGLRDLRIHGTFVDVGAHIGAVSLAILLDNRWTRAILVEPLPENLELARQTMAVNGLMRRAMFVQAAVGTDKVRYGKASVGDRYVGNIGSHKGRIINVETTDLPALVDMAGGTINALKVDCEGGEWALLDSPALTSVDLIFGEWHGNTRDRDGESRLHRLLDATHNLISITDVGGIGLFRAVRR